MEEGGDQTSSSALCRPPEQSHWTCLFKNLISETALDLPSEGLGASSGNHSVRDTPR